MYFDRYNFPYRSAPEYRRRDMVAAVRAAAEGARG